jgi:metastasis-associated protein MTA
MKNQLARHYATSHGFSMRSGSPRPVMKTRTAFYLHTTPMTRVSRRICSDIVKTRHATRSPFWPVNVMLIKQECKVDIEMF